MNNIKRTYQLPTHGVIMKEFIKKVQYEYARSCDRYFYNNTILSFTREQVEQELKERFERSGWFYLKVVDTRIEKRNEIQQKELERTKKYSIERARKVEEKPKRFLRK